MSDSFFHQDEVSTKSGQLQFFEQETTQGYLDVLHALVRRHGAPLALYSDRHSIFTKANPEDAKPTQFERALLQLDIAPPVCPFAVKGDTSTLGAGDITVLGPHGESA